MTKIDGLIQAVKKNDCDFLNGVKHLTEESARIIARLDGDKLTLNNVRRLSQNTARILSSWKGSHLSLDGLQQLDHDTAKELTNWQGNYLYLNGINILTTDTARAIASWKGSILFLNGVQNLTLNTGKALALWKGEILILGGLQRLSPATAMALALWAGACLVLNERRDISRDTARTMDLWREGLIIFGGTLSSGIASTQDLDSIISIIKKDDEGHLHCDDGPALVIHGVHRIYSINGVRVPEHVVERPEEITVNEIEEKTNTEIRRILIEKYGEERYLLETGAKQIHEDSAGSLFKKQSRRGEPIVMVKVRNSTPEIDGSFKDYFLRVPPDIKTAHQAVAWTFGMSQEAYQPILET
jgi:hypothetical protein